MKNSTPLGSHRTSWGGSDKKEREGVGAYESQMGRKKHRSRSGLGPTLGRLGLFPGTPGNKCLDRTLTIG